MFSEANNIFDNLLDIVTSLQDNHDKLDHYLAKDMEDVKDSLLKIICQSQISVPASLLSLLIFCPLATTVDIE